jgi:hypothetical protein
MSSESVERSASLYEPDQFCLLLPLIKWGWISESEPFQGEAGRYSLVTESKKSSAQLTDRNRK